MKFFVLLWVHGGLKQGKENVLQHLGKIRYKLLCLENVTEKQKNIVLYDKLLLYFQIIGFKQTVNATHYILGTWMIHLMFGECTL